MAKPLSSLAKAIRWTMFFVGAALLALGVWKIPGMELTTAEQVIGWLVLALGCGQSVAAGLLAGHIPNKYSSQCIFSLLNVVGLAVFCMVIFSLQHMEVQMKELRLMLLLAVSFQFTCMLLGLAWLRR